MFCVKCNTEKPLDPSTKSWCTDCRKAARAQAIQFRQTHPKKMYGGRTYESRDFILRELGFRNYREYLSSPLWRSVRSRVFAFKGRICFMCGKPATSIHHNRYHKNDLTGKHMMFIHPICDECHKGIEFSRKGRKLQLHEAKDRFTKHVQRDSQYLTALILDCDPEQ